MRWKLAVDLGGSGSRARLMNGAGLALAEVTAGPGALSLGLAQSRAALDALMVQLAQREDVRWGECAAVVAAAGAHHPGACAAFIEVLPDFAASHVCTDGDASLMGAHRGMPGLVVAIGTGVVGEALLPNGQRRTVSGWGFPAGDEGGGAWLGMQAVQRALWARDGRAPSNRLTTQVWQQMGGSIGPVFDWLGKARPADYAAMAPVVIGLAQELDDFAVDLCRNAGEHLWTTALALEHDALGGEPLPIALLGGLAGPLKPWLPAPLLRRLVAPQGSALDGACWLLDQPEALRQSVKPC